MLRILHLEDCQADAFLTQRALADGPIAAEVTHVKNHAEFCDALEKRDMDLILADGGVPGFGGQQALELAREKCPGVPFICLSGSVDEKQIAASLNAGAAEYVLKDQPWQFIAAIRRVLETVHREEEKTRLLRLNKGMARLVAAVQELSLARDMNGIMNIVRRAARELSGADGATFVLREGEMCHYAEEDAVEPLWKGQRFPMSACISGWTMLNRKPAIIEDIYADSRVPVDA